MASLFQEKNKTIEIEIGKLIFFSLSLSLPPDVPIPWLPQ